MRVQNGSVDRSECQQNRLKAKWLKLYSPHLEYKEYAYAIKGESNEY